MVEVISNNDPEVILKKEEYMAYIDEHKNNVLKAFDNLLNKVILKGNTKLEKIMRDWSLESADLKYHDLSKYTQVEFDAYRRKFHPTTSEKQEDDQEKLKIIDEQFEEAWFHHYTSNNHHPAYWTHVNENGEISRTPFPARDMPIETIIHMICDWEAMSIKFGGTTIEWYISKAHKERKNMSKNTIKVLEDLLKEIYSYDGEFNYDE